MATPTEPAGSALRYARYEALGNDYLVLSRDLLGDLPSPPAIRALCDRTRGLGSDGILLGRAEAEGYRLRIFNPDGSEAEKSGNGLRIFARHAFDGDGRTNFRIATAGGVAEAWILDPAGRRIRIDMGPPDFARGPGGAEVLDEAAVVLGEPCTLSLVSMGNPHCVVRGLRADEATARRLGPEIERDARFPGRTNVQFLEVDSRAAIRIAIWERGAGFTLASGSSSCAAAAVARRLGLVDDRVEVRMPGGVLEVEFAAGRILMTGSVAKICEGVIAADLLERIGLP